MKLSVEEFIIPISIYQHRLHYVKSSKSWKWTVSFTSSKYTTYQPDFIEVHNKSIGMVSFSVLHRFRHDIREDVEILYKHVYSAEVKSYPNCQEQIE